MCAPLDSDFLDYPDRFEMAGSTAEDPRPAPDRPGKEPLAPLPEPLPHTPAPE